ncbi:3-oxoacyl-[acyl-carrier-protein] reductase [Sinanaerobacter sp. ZZT-01]|uniref:3-oxoacyl-[acyl-carrier-protein] reductase n=1 Tax=Sinanaerobacter sp. ZZT-01 TaxID=3111540 RepID=UPI002D794A7B|nr:3-oxoacyl-[acyl-carrier-protein] reductase [Sinanaerobacter sp. ZZT-01]WRR92097.1 3-oxoacyl-[acyl-carrier-protein] reductase [Sinanaerobacter sp. ZZT-01]
MLKNKTAFITGASRGIGKAIALAMAKNGANIAFTYVSNQTAAVETCEEIRGLGVDAEAFLCDVTDFSQAGETVKAIVARFGKVDILVNNAGITKDGLILTMKEQDFDQVINTNLKGAFHIIKHMSGPFMKQRKGSIINISSVSGLMGNPGQANYSAAKAGLIGLTKTVAKEFAPRGVTCNAIAPGFIETDMTAKLSEKAKVAALEAIPLKRMGSPEDIANVAVFLASDQANYITGEIIKVDGGLYV